MKENANKLDFKCTESTDFNSSTHVLCMLCVFMYFFNQNIVLVAEYHVDC